MKRNFKKFGEFLLATWLLLSAGCAAPIFSDLQSAKLLDPGKVEVTPGFSSISFADEGESFHTQDNVGFQLGVGLARTVNLRFRYEYLWVDSDGENETADYNILALGPKVGIVEDWFSVYVPVGLAVEDEHSIQTHPTVLFTIPFNQYIEFNTAAKYIWTFERDYSDAFGFNIGAGLSTDLDQWVARPEFGMLFPAEKGSTGYYYQFGIGLTYYFSGRKKLPPVTKAPAYY